VVATDIELELWLPIGEAPGYEVSSWGRVRKGEEPVEAWENAKGYHLVNLELPPLHDGEPPQLLIRYVHRLVLQAFEPSAAGLQVNHDDGVKGHNELGNLEWTTPAGNLTHAWATGLIARIRRSHRSVCRHGHPLDQVYRQRDRAGSMRTWRRCSRCRRASYRARKARGAGVLSLLDLLT
jgi:hypothetical protein